MNKKKQIKTLTFTSKSKGYQKEERVCEYLIERGWKIIYKNKKILGVEIDILAQRKEEQMVIEVKSISDLNHIEKILKPVQKRRLQKVSESLCSKPEESIRLFLATVDSKNQIDFFEIN